MPNIVGILVVIGFGLLPFIILVCSAIWSRNVSAVLGWAVVAIVLMVFQFMLGVWAAGIGSATSTSQHGYSVVGGALVVYVISLVLYFVLALARLARKK